MALRVINGGRKGKDGIDDPVEEPAGRTRRSDATEVDVDDDDDDGLGDSTIIGVPAPPPSARTAGVGKFDFDDLAIDDALSSIEEKASVAIPAPKAPARHFPSPTTHGRAQSAHETTPPPQAQPWQQQPTGPRPPTGPYPHPNQYPPANQYPPTGQYPNQYPPTGAYPQQAHYPPTGPYPQHAHYPPTGQIPHVGQMATPMPGAPPLAPAPKTSRVALYAVVGALLALALGGIVAYAVVAKGNKKNNVASGSGSAGSATEVASLGSAGSATSTGSAGSAVVPRGSAGSAVVSNGSAGSATSGSAGSAAPPASTTAKANLSSVEHPIVGDCVKAEGKAQVATIAVASPRAVKSGEALFTMKSRSGANVDALAKRVNELEALAKEDPDSYGPFLKRARNELRAGQAPITTTIKASSAGTFQSKVKVGDQVAPGSVLGCFIDARTWIGVADIEGAKAIVSWGCTVADNTHTAACKIQATEVINGGSGTRVTVEISATGTSWLEGPSHPWLVLEPPD